MTDAQRWLPLKPETFEILLAMAEEAVHGYAILKALDARGVPVAASLLYRKIRRLMEDGLVSETVGPADLSLDDPRRRYYTLTAAGRGVVQAEASRIVELASSRRIRRLTEEVDHA